MKVLITGATGFVGKAVTNELTQNSIAVISLGGPGSAASGQGLHVDITNPKDISKLEKIGKVDAVIHSAGLAHQFGKVRVADFWNVNVRGTENVAGLAVKLKVRHFLLISSVLVYGQTLEWNGTPFIITEESPCSPRDAYARSKLAAEAVATDICEKAHIPLTILRPAPIIGEGSKGNFSRLIKLISRRRFVWLGNGSNRKSLVSVEDVARACRVLIQNKKAETEIFNISGDAIGMKELVSEIFKQSGRKPLNFSIPVAPVLGFMNLTSRLIPHFSIIRFKNTIEKWISEDIYSAEKIKREYGFAATSDMADVLSREISRQIENK